MAKQQRVSGVVAAARRVSDTQGAFQDRGGQFMTGYNKSLEAKKEREAKNKETQTRVNSLMGQFKNDIDVLKFKPEDQTLVKNTIAGWRNEYAEAANAAAQIQDKSSPEYQALMDTMNGVKNKMANLKGNLDNLAAFKGEYAENIKAGHYSNAGANDMSLAQGEVMLQYPIGSIGENGDLMWNNEAGGGEFGFQDYQMPFEKATGLATALGAISDPLLTQKTPLNDIQRAGIREKVDALLSNKNQLASLISESDLPQFDFSNIDPDDPNAKQQVADLLVKSIEGLRGTGLVPDKKDEKKDSQTGLTKAQEVAKKLDIVFEYPGIPKTIGGLKIEYNPDLEMTEGYNYDLPANDPSQPKTVQKGGYMVGTGENMQIVTYEDLMDILSV